MTKKQRTPHSRGMAILRGFARIADPNRTLSVRRKNRRVTMADIDKSDDIGRAWRDVGKYLSDAMAAYDKQARGYK